jgi:hypothetical protein
MSRLGNRVTTFVKNYWGCLTPPLFVHHSTEGSQPLTDLDAVLRTGMIDPIVLAKHLLGMPLYDSNGEAVKEVQVRRLLRHHPDKRCTLEIGLRTEGGWHFLIAKFYRKDRSDVFQAMKGVQQSGFGPQDQFSIPQPVGYTSSLHCLLQEMVNGALAVEIFKTGDELTRAAAAERCALWLARFHALGPKAGSSSYAKDYLSPARYSLDIAKRDGRCGDKAACLHQRLEDAVGSLSPAELCAGHGHYRADHVVLAQGRAVVFDWDGYDVADPARDVARFLAALRRLAVGWLGSVRAMDGTVEVFLNTYLAAGPPEAKKNLRFFAAATYLNLAKHTLCRPGPHKQEKHDIAEALLDEGLRVLDGETV